MLLTCWKIAYVRGLQPAFCGHTPVLLQPHGVTDSVQLSSYRTSSIQPVHSQSYTQPTVPSARVRVRAGWLLPLSSLASGVGLAWYFDPGLKQVEQRPDSRKAEPTVPRQQSLLSPQCQRLKNQLENIAMRQNMLKTELQALQALNDKSRDSLQRRKELKQELTALEQQHALVVEEAKEEILKNPAD